MPLPGDPLVKAALDWDLDLLAEDNPIGGYDVAHQSVLCEL